MTRFPEAWQQLYDSWPPRVSRRTIASTKLIAVQTLSNYDCERRGIPGKKTAGKKVFYPKAEAIQWLMDYCNEEA